MIPGRHHKICAQCGTGFWAKRPHAVYCTGECRHQGWIENEVLAAQGAYGRVKAEDLDEVRARGEEAKGEKARWTLIVREHIAHTLVATGYVSAEDLDVLGVPPEHVNVGNSWLAHFSKQKLMTAVSWRVSAKPSRKGAKVWTYRITAKGREKLPPLLKDVRAKLAGLHADDSSGEERGPSRALAPVGVQSGENPQPTGADVDQGVRTRKESLLKAPDVERVGVGSGGSEEGSAGAGAVPGSSAGPGGSPAPPDKPGPSEIADQAPPASEGTGQLFPVDPPSAYNPWKDAA